MRIKDANLLRNVLKENAYRKGFFGRFVRLTIEAIDSMPEIEVVPMEDYKSLQERCKQLEKRLADVSSSPFDGGMSRQEYFRGETDCKRRERWLLAFTERRGTCDFEYHWRCSGCNAQIKTNVLRPPSEHRCHNCGACMDWGVSDG